MVQSINTIIVGLVGYLVIAMVASFVVGLLSDISFNALDSSTIYCWLDDRIVRIRFHASILSLIGQVIGCFGGGWIVARRAPSSPLTHTVVYAVIAGALSIGYGMPG